MANLETLPTALEVARSNWWKSDIEKITLKVSQNPERLNSHEDEQREAQGEPNNSNVALLWFISVPFGVKETPHQFDNIPLRISVVDLLQLYEPAQLPMIPEDRPPGRTFQKLGVQECMDNLWGYWYTTSPNMIILTCGDDFLARCASDSWRKVRLKYDSWRKPRQEYDGNENIQWTRRSLKVQLEQECALLRPYDVEIRIMWNSEEAEVHRLGNTIRDLHARTVTVKGQVA